MISCQEDFCRPCVSCRSSTSALRAGRRALGGFSGQDGPLELADLPLQRRRTRRGGLAKALLQRGGFSLQAAHPGLQLHQGSASRLAAGLDPRQLELSFLQGRLAGEVPAPAGGGRVVGGAADQAGLAGLELAGEDGGLDFLPGALEEFEALARLPEGPLLLLVSLGGQFFPGRLQLPARFLQELAQAAAPPGLFESRSLLIESEGGLFGQDQLRLLLLDKRLAFEQGLLGAVSILGELPDSSSQSLVSSHGSGRQALEKDPRHAASRYNLAHV